MKYPINERIQAARKRKGMTLNELAAKIQKTDRWIQSIHDIENLTLHTISSLNMALELDLIKDYNDWIIEHDGTPITMTAEPNANFLWKQKISVNITITGTISQFNQDFGDFIKTLRKESEKHGFDIS